MIENNINVSDSQEKTNKKNWYLIVLLLILLLVGIIVGAFLYREKRGAKESISNSPSSVAETSADTLVPKNAKNQEEFLSKVQEESAAIQKNYDNNLTEFARKRWEKLFWEINAADASESENKLNVLSQEIQKTDDQSTLYKIKYRVEQGKNELEMEDFYYLILSEAKRVELGVDNIKSNVFLSEEDIKNNLTRENFVKIGKIQ